MVRSWRTRPVGWRNESHRHYLAAKGVSTKRYFANLGKQKLPDFLVMHGLAGVKRPRLTDAFYVRRSGDADVPVKHQLELLQPGNRVRVRLAKAKPKEEVELDVKAVDNWSDLHVGTIVMPNNTYPVGTQIFFRRKNVLRITR